MNKLSADQKRAIEHLARFPPSVWVDNTPVTQKCLNTLQSKGLVETIFDELEDGNKFFERLTEDGWRVAYYLGISQIAPDAETQDRKKKVDELLADLYAIWAEYGLDSGLTNEALVDLMHAYDDWLD